MAAELPAAQQDPQSAKPDKPPAAGQNDSPGQGPEKPAPKDSPGSAPSGNAGNSSPSNAQGTGVQNGTSNDRLFWTLPNFLTVEGSGTVPPLTSGQKFKVVARGMFDPVEFVWVGLLAGIDQASNSNPSYGQGAAGYGKRYATSFGDTLIENFMVGAIFPSMLHQDPRYFRLAKGSFLHRTGYALGRVFVTRSDSGVKQFNYSEIFGSAVAAGISTYSYHPESDQKLSNVGGVWGTQVCSDAVSFMLKEFWPDIHRKFHKKPAA
jgi:hypothetical protein